MTSRNPARGLHQAMPSAFVAAVRQHQDRLWQGVCHERVTVSDAFISDTVMCQQPAAHVTYDVFEHQFYPVCPQHS